jgi:sodium/potassium-transporting ATPase subunit alpha
MKLFKAASTSASPILPNEEFEAAEGYLLLVKGAPDILIKRCSSILAADGSSLPLTGSTFEELTEAQRTMASQGQRVLLLARRILSSAHITKEAASGRFTLAEAAMAANQDLQIVGLVGLVDPPRADTLETVRVCRGAGIRFFMVRCKTWRGTWLRSGRLLATLR